MKRLLIALMICLMPVCGWGANYYVRADGEVLAAAKANATGCASASTALNVAQHNAASFSAGDTIYLCSDGGDFTTMIQPPTAGVTYTAASGKNVVINIASGGARSFYNPVKDTTINGTLGGGTITIGGGTSQSFYCLNSSGVTVSNVTVSSSTVNGLQFNACDDATVSNVTVTTTGPHGIFMGGTTATATVDGATITANGVASNGFAISGCTAPSLSNITISAVTLIGIKVIAENNLDLTGSNWTTTGGTGSGLGGIHINGNSKTGISFELTNLTSSGNGAVGILIDTGTYTAGSITGFTSTGNTSHGVYINGASNITLSGGTSATNTADGIRVNGAVSGIVITGNTVNNNGVDGISFVGGATGTITKNTVHTNGQVDTASNGDGITSHAGCYNLKITENVIYSNRNSGLAFVGDSTGVAYNNTITSNGDSTSVNMGVRGGYYSTSSGVWHLRNNILMANYPYEIQGGRGIEDNVDYSVYYHVGDKFGKLGGSETTWAAYHTDSSKEPNSIYGNPYFTSASDFSLLSTSPAINAGTDLCSTLTTATDMNDNAVCTDGKFAGTGYAPSIGAYQYQGILYVNTSTGDNTNTGGTSDSARKTVKPIATWLADEKYIINGHTVTQSYIDGKVLCIP